MAGVSTKPYLIRAIHEWCVDEGYTPHIAVVVDHNVLVPPGYARDGRIILNLSPDATNLLSIGNDVITFQARFGGKVHDLYIPIANVLGIYSAESGQGMGFEVMVADAEDEQQADDELLGAVPADAVEDVRESDADGEPRSPSDPSDSPKRGHLKLVK